MNTPVDITLIQKAVEIIRSGGLVVFPTRCLYGIAVDAFDSEAVGRLFRLKERPPEKPVSILVPSLDILKCIVSDIPEAGRALLEAVWPGRLTVVLPALAAVPDVLTAGTGTIGVRLPAHPAAAALAAALKRPITGTSANRSGRPGCSDIADLDPLLAANVDLVIDAGPLIGGAGSTVLDLTAAPFKILREGAAPRSELEAIVGPTTIA